MTVVGADLARVSSRGFLLYLHVHVLSWHESLYHRVTLDRKKPLLAARRGVDGGCYNREYLPAGSVSFAYRILASPSCQIRCRGARIMSHADIEKWVSGEIEVFDPHQIALPSGDSNPQRRVRRRGLFSGDLPSLQSPSLLYAWELVPWSVLSFRHDIPLSR